MNGNFTVFDSIVDSCKIITNTGTILNFRHMVLEINIYEDIFVNYISGNLVINDGFGYINALQLDGTERVVLHIKNPNRHESIEKVYRLYKISDRKFTSQTNETYILHFCSEELLLSEQKRISKSYKEIEVYKMVYDICLNSLKIPVEKINVEETIGLRSIIIPMYKPFQALNWLCAQGLSKLTAEYGTTFLFYENKNGFSFSSLHSLFQQNVYRSFLYELKTINNPDNYKEPDTDRKYNVVLHYEHINNFDKLKAANLGTFNTKVMTFDPMRGLYSQKIFDYKNFSTLPTLNKVPFETDMLNRFGDSVDDTTSRYKLVVTTSGQSNNEYIKDKEIVIPENRIENTVPYRQTQLSLLTNNKIRIVIPGDVGMTIGCVINFNLPSLSKGKFESEFDPFYSGRFLVTSVRHIIHEKGFKTVLDICKDSSPNARLPADNTSIFNTVIK